MHVSYNAVCFFMCRPNWVELFVNGNTKLGVTTRVGVVIT